MPMVAEVVDAVVGGDTHRDTHTLELTGPSGAALAVLTIDNDEAALAGGSPLPASSGRTTRYRLNRGPDRRLNIARELYRALNSTATT